MKRLVRALLVLLLLSGFAGVASAAGPPAFGVTFDATAEYLRIAKGTTHGLKTDYGGPGATTGTLLDAQDGEVGAFVTVYADDFETIVRITGYAEGRTSADIDHAAIASLGLGYITLTREESGAYFRIDKGRSAIDPHVLKRAAKGGLYDEQGRLAALYRVVAVGEAESLGIITQYERGFHAHDLRTGDITGYVDQIVQSSGFANFTVSHLIMLIVGLLFLWLAIVKDYEPLLLVPIGFGILIGNIPLPLSIFNSVSVYMIDPVSHEYVFNTGSNSVLGMIYAGVRTGLFPPLIFLGIGALTDSHSWARSRWASRLRAPRRSGSSAGPTGRRRSSRRAGSRLR